MLQVDMKARGLEPNVISYKAAISAFEKEQQWEQELAPIYKIRETNMTANVVSCRVAISVCEKGGQWQQAVTLLRKVRA